jgi:hypothetical protein
MHQRIQAEFSHANNPTDATSDDNEGAGITGGATSVEKGNINTVSTIKRKKKPKDSKPKVDAFQKSEKMKQLEAFERARDAKAKEKKRQDRIEKEAKREVELLPFFLLIAHYFTIAA